MPFFADHSRTANWSLCCQSESAGRAPIALACLCEFGIAAGALERLAHAVEAHLQLALARCGKCRRIGVALDLLEFGAQRLIALVGAGEVQRKLLLADLRQTRSECLAAVREHVAQHAETLLPLLQVAVERNSRSR